MSSFQRPAFLFLMAATLSLMGTAAVIFYFIEIGHNPGITDLFESLYFVVTTMTGVGFGDIVPKTFLGKIFSMCLMLLGTALFVTFTAFLSTLLIEAEIDFAEKNSDS